MFTQDIPSSDYTFDVIICGGGLAGQTLARQLKISQPSLSVLMIIKSAMPLVATDFKVGESTVEVSAFYLSETLRLTDYFRNNHYRKFGFRYFLGSGNEVPANRPEVGLSAYPPYDSYQIDRGVLENDLYHMNLHADVHMITDATVKAIQLSDSAAPHKVIYQTGKDQLTKEIKCRWVVDASGRRQLIQRALQLSEPPETICNSTWWRVKGRLDVDDLVPKTHRDYYKRVASKSRFFSTTHLHNRGYWVWLIPLSSGNTSVGIVTTESIHPFESYNTFEKSMQWLSIHEPVLYRHMKQFEVLDFLKMKNYSYGSKQLFSVNRWACTGEAGLFTDPYYSPGSNFIAFENTMITKMITDDVCNDERWKTQVDAYNDFIISMNKWLTKSIQSSYTYFHLDIVMALSFLWDVAAGWSFITPRMFNSIYLDPTATAYLKETSLRFFTIAYNVENFFNEWKTQTPDTYTFDFINYLSVPFLRQIYARNVKSGKTTAQLKTEFEENLRDLEAFAQVLFWIALEDVHPEMTDLLKEKPWLNASAICLDPALWKERRLFEPDTPPADITGIYHQLKSLFRKREQADAGVGEDLNYSFK